MRALSSAKLLSACSYCGEMEGKLRYCTACRALKYCSTKCQSRDWALHGAECAVLKRLGPERVLPAIARMAIRLLIADTQSAKHLSTLQLHVDDMQTSARWPDIMLTAKAVHAYFGSSIADACRALCACSINSISWARSSDGEVVGSVVDVNVSMCNHSCIPNAAVAYAGAHLYLSATMDIAAGEEITIPYVDPFTPRPRRQAELLSRYFFTCRCRRCVDGPALQEGDAFDPSSTAAVTLESQELLSGKQGTPELSDRLLSKRVRQRLLQPDYPRHLSPLVDDMETLASHYMAAGDFARAGRVYLYVMLVIGPAREAVMGQIYWTVHYATALECASHLSASSAYPFTTLDRLEFAVYTYDKARQLGKIVQRYRSLDHASQERLRRMSLDMERQLLEVISKEDLLDEGRQRMRVAHAEPLMAAELEALPDW